jgi:hypothetical protein
MYNNCIENMYIYLVNGSHICNRLIIIKLIKMSSSVNQPTLFNMMKLVQRPIPDQRNFEIEYFDLLKALPGIIMQAFNLTNKAKRKKRPMSMNRNWFANELSGNVLDLVAQSFPHYVQRTGRGSHCLVLKYKYECYLKKLDKKLSPLYNHSKTSKRLTNQEALPTQEPIPVIFMGWTINKTNDAILGYYAVCRKGDERIWSTDLTAIARPKNLEIAGSQHTAVPETKPLVTIKPKEKRKRK